VRYNVCFDAFVNQATELVNEMVGMMDNGLIGYTGFVGENLTKQLGANVECFNSKNIEKIHRLKFDTLYISAIQAKKWWANQNPLEDKRLINELLTHLSKVKANKVVFISTVDVYQPPIGVDEDALTTNDIHAYGENRLYAEQCINELFDDVHIIRLQGLVANNLSKNIIFDLKNKNILESINPDSCLQWYPLSRLVSDINVVIKNDIRLINLSVEPVASKDIIGIAPLSDEQRKIVATAPAAAVKYDVTSKYAALFGGDKGYIVSASESLSNIQNYFKS